MSSTVAPSWHTLPIEMKWTIIESLEDEDVKSLSMVDQKSYQACVPSRFKNVKLDSFDAIVQFLENVPRSYCSYIEHLDLCTKDDAAAITATTTTTSPTPRVRADQVIALLSASPRLSSLNLRIVGSLDKSIVAPFPFLNNLQHLSIANCGDEHKSPLSERLVLAIALSTPYLSELSLDRITRSRLHAPELEGAFPLVPLALNDEDITVASSCTKRNVNDIPLNLPSLLRIPTLSKLTIKDTHLGDPSWTTTPVDCRLQVLDLGSCYHADPGFNSRCTERIMSAVGPSVSEFSLTSALPTTATNTTTSFTINTNVSSAKSKPTPLPRLRKLHISPYFPVDRVVETVSHLAGSPVERISVQCFKDDVVEMCEALEEFLSLRVEKGEEFYGNLKRIDVVSVAAPVPTPGGEEEEPVDEEEEDEEEKEERKKAAMRLQCLCKDLKLASVVGQKTVEKRVKRTGSLSGRFPIRSSSFHSFASPVSALPDTAVRSIGRPRRSSVACFATGALVEDPLEMDDKELEALEKMKKMAGATTKARSMTLH
ncbi:hypothetical protein BJ165DRAFT_1418228 [Panaeolus papilionaceus]|nr:hypothetical protein BJ165DRAFT_1418228 [Panaeolus papilionaceus]